MEIYMDEQLHQAQIRTPPKYYFEQSAKSESIEILYFWEILFTRKHKFM